MSQRCSLWAAPENTTHFTRAFARSCAFVWSFTLSFHFRYVTALLFLSIDKLARVPNSFSPLSRVLRRYKVSLAYRFFVCVTLFSNEFTNGQQVCNIMSFCGVSLVNLANRHLVTSPELARARASVLEYLLTPSLETDDDAVEFNIVEGFMPRVSSDDSGRDYGFYGSREREGGVSEAKDVQTAFSEKSCQLCFVDDFRGEASISQHLPSDYTSIMDMYGRCCFFMYLCLLSSFPLCILNNAQF
jgi:hypothetical protein